MKIFKYLFASALLYSFVSLSSVYADELPMDCPPPVPETIEISDDDISLSAFDYELTPYSADDIDFSVDSNGHAKAIRTSYSDDNCVTAVINGTTINFTGKLSHETASYLWLAVDSTKKTFAFDPNKEFSASLSLSSLKDGSYQYKIYKSYNGTNYTSIMYHNVTVTKSSNDIYFDIPYSVYDDNSYMSAENFRVPSSYISQTYPWVTVDSDVKQWAESITSGCKTSYDKILAVHDWVADNVYYDHDYTQGSAASTNLDTKDVYNKTDSNGKRYSVCQGYSSLCAGLLRSLGIPCKVSEGYGKSSASKAWSDINASSTNHAWNEAWCEEQQRWIIFDSTWDSGRDKDYNGSSYSKGSYVDTELKHLYFDVSQEVFAGDHRLHTYSRSTAAYNYGGDVNYDSKVDETDAALYLKYFYGAATFKRNTITYTDVNGDGVLDFLDAVAMPKKLEFIKRITGPV